MLIFFNGYLGFGSPQGGRVYWNENFIRGAKSYFNDQSYPYFTDIDYRPFSFASKRQTEGYEYARDNYKSLIDGMNTDEPFRIIAHSMGSALAVGTKKLLEERGWKIETMVFLNSFQSDKIKLNKKEGTVIIDYQNTNDPVTNGFDLSWGHDRKIENADFKIREKSNNNLSYRHRGPISSGNEFWDNLGKKCAASKTQVKR